MHDGEHTVPIRAPASLLTSTSVQQTEAQAGDGDENSESNDEFGDFLQSEDIDPWKTPLDTVSDAKGSSEETRSSGDFVEPSNGSANDLSTPDVGSSAKAVDLPVLQPEDHAAQIPPLLPPPPAVPGTAATPTSAPVQGESSIRGHQSTAASRKSSMSIHEDPLNTTSTQILSWISATSGRRRSAGSFSEKIDSTWTSASGLFGENQIDHITEIARRIGSIIPDDASNPLAHRDVTSDQRVDESMESADLDKALARLAVHKPAGTLSQPDKHSDVAPQIWGIVWPKATKSSIRVAEAEKIDGDLLVNAYLRLAELSKTSK
ncbi:hypothetical protein GGI12_000759 [Dipsacomyces acuminosporus]|nr:hypothetical protein GGI12_000759 [Dipsacomyces acuminosporus]